MNLMEASATRDYSDEKKKFVESNAVAEANDAKKRAKLSENVQNGGHARTVGNGKKATIGN